MFDQHACKARHSVMAGECLAPENDHLVELRLLAGFQMSLYALSKMTGLAIEHKLGGERNAGAFLDADVSGFTAGLFRLEAGFLHEFAGDIGIDVQHAVPHILLAERAADWINETGGRRVGRHSPEQYVPLFGL